MKLQRLAAQLLGHQAGLMIDIRVVLALHSTGKRHHGDVELPVGLDVLHHRPDGLATRDGDDVAIADGLHQMVGSSKTDLLQRRVRATFDGRCNQRF